MARVRGEIEIPTCVTPPGATKECSIHEFSADVPIVKKGDAPLNFSLYVSGVADTCVGKSIKKGGLHACGKVFHYGLIRKSNDYVFCGQGSKWYQCEFMMMKKGTNETVPAGPAEVVPKEEIENVFKNSTCFGTEFGSCSTNSTRFSKCSGDLKTMVADYRIPKHTPYKCLMHGTYCYRFITMNNKIVPVHWYNYQCFK